MRFGFFIIVGVLMLGCAHKSASGQPRPVNSYTEPYQISALDRIFLKNKDGEEIALIIGQNGDLTLPNDQTFGALGLDIATLNQKVTQSMPEALSVRVEEFRGNRVTVMGEVFHQLHVEMSDAPMRVLDVIAAANGFTPLANTGRVRLIRQNAGQVNVFELNMGEVMKGKNTYQNMLVKPGDVISVPRNFL